MTGSWKGLVRLFSTTSAGMLRIGDALTRRHLAFGSLSSRDVVPFRQSSSIFAASSWIRPFHPGSCANHSDEQVNASSGGALPVPVPESIEEIRSRIFGTHIGNGLRSGRKILRRKLIGNKIASYYPEDITKKDPFMPDLIAER